MVSEREWLLLTAERFLREDAPRVELVLPIDSSREKDGIQKPPISALDALSGFLFSTRVEIALRGE